MRAFLFNQKMSFLLCFFFIVSSFLNTFVSPTQHLCNPDQRDALIEFKTEFEIIQQPTWYYSSEVSSYPKTESWGNNIDCCSWDGITCDANSGEVVGLNLSASCLHGQLKSNSSLFRLSHLRDLNLAYNNFTASPIPNEFEKLKGLERLNLSKSSFSDKIPNKLLQLTKLVSLDLSSFFLKVIDHSSSSLFNYPQNSLSIDESFLHLLAQNLRNLRDLDMSYLNISSKIPHEFSNMWSLRSLCFEGCNLFGEFPRNVFLIPNLQSISLNINPNLRGNLPVFHRNNSMQIISLYFTSFSGTIPDSISNLKHLTSLTLFFSHFSGRIPSSIGNLSHLSYIDLSDNKFTGFLPPNISQLSKLEVFSADRNYFVGAIPSSLFTISSLTHIYLEDNQLNDILGIENISLLPNLQHLYLGYNNFIVSPFDLNVFSPLKNLEELSLSGIPLSTAKITIDSDFQSHLKSLYLSGCNITEFPQLIRNQRNIEILYLSDNKIKGHVPNWLLKLPDLFIVDLSNNFLSGFEGSLKASFVSEILNFLDLSSNAFQGPLFIPSKSIQFYSASKNNFTGEIPRSICGLTSPGILDLSDNNLHGSIPRCLETYMSSISDLNLRNNFLSGNIPDIFMHAKELISLDVSHNQLEGKLPASLSGCSTLEVLNVESNKISDTFPFQLNSLHKLQVIVLRFNKFHGKLHQADGVWSGFTQLKIIDVSHNDFIGTLPSDYFLNWTAISSKRDNCTPYTELNYLGNPGALGFYASVVLMSKGVSMEMERILKIYTAVDFSGNQLHGKIPGSIGLLKELSILNLSRNAFTGHIPSSMANMTNLESLDLSQNKISGEIPPELGALSSLSWINISHNQLVGPIPQGTQFQRQNCSSYEGNPGLYGPSLKDVCGDNHAPTPEKCEPSEEDEEWFSWIAAGLGHVPGVVFGLVIGYIVASYKHEWFMKTFGRKKHQSTRTR